MSTQSPHRPLREAGGVELELATDRIMSLLGEALADRLVAVYVIGSLATGDAHPAISDLDLIVVVDSVIADATLVGIGEQLAEAAAEVPMRGLEAVVYRADVLAAPSYPLTIELNVNAGAELERVVATRTDEPFWFLLDVAAARDSAFVLHGSPPRPEVRTRHGLEPRADVAVARRGRLGVEDPGGPVGTRPHARARSCRRRSCLTDGWQREDDRGEPPLVALRRVAYQRSLIEKDLADAVRDALKSGASWAKIGREPGTSGEAARQRYADKIDA